MNLSLRQYHHWFLDSMKQQNVSIHFKTPDHSCDRQKERKVKKKEKWDINQISWNLNADGASGDSTETRIGVCAGSDRRGGPRWSERAPGDRRRLGCFPPLVDAILSIDASSTSPITPDLRQDIVVCPLGATDPDRCPRRDQESLFPFPFVQSIVRRWILITFRRDRFVSYFLFDYVFLSYTRKGKFPNPEIQKTMKLWDSVKDIYIYVWRN